MSTYQENLTVRFLETCGYAVVRSVPFSAGRLAEIRDMAASCLDKAMRGMAASKVENSALCKLGILSISLHERINKEYRYNYGMLKA